MDGINRPAAGDSVAGANYSEKFAPAAPLSKLPAPCTNKKRGAGSSLLLDKDVKSRGNRHKGKQRAGENTCPYFLRSISIILRVRRETAAENKRWRTKRETSNAEERRDRRNGRRHAETTGLAA